MALTLLTDPADPFSNVNDWTEIKAYLNALFLNWNGPISQVDYDNDLVLKGAVLQIGAAFYKGISDTAITGTPSDYVKITPSGATASAAYVANLTGVTWNDTYNGYYDVSTNLYIFDENKAYYNDEITSTNYRYLSKSSDGSIYAPGLLASSGISKLTTSGNFTVPDGVKKMKLTMSGGGGGGGGGAGDAGDGGSGGAGGQTIFDTTYMAAGGSGGTGGNHSGDGYSPASATNNKLSGSEGGQGGFGAGGENNGTSGYNGILEIYYDDVTPGDSLAYTIGAGGTAGAGGASGPNNSGGAGVSGADGYIIVEY